MGSGAQRVIACAAERRAVAAVFRDGELRALVRRAGEAPNDFAAPRLMTTLALLALLAIVVSLLT